MGQCHWKECPNEATKTVYRNTTEEERKASEHRTDKGFGWVAFVEREVCDQHLEEAQKEYPYIKNI